MTGPDPAGSAEASAASVSVALVGPSHPYKGGVASHTTTLAHELVEGGHQVRLISWRQLYPSFLYPGEQSVPDQGSPDVAPFSATERVLAWSRPQSLIRAGRSIRDVDVIVLVHVIPPVVPLHLLLLGAAGVGSSRKRRGRRRGPRVVVIAHNVLPHEPHPGDRALMRALFSRVDSVLVHSAEQAQLAESLGADQVVAAPLPPHLPGGPPAARAPHHGPARLLALGLVRGYKGIDVLLRALREVPDVTLTVAGEMWGDAGARVRELAADPSLAGRVRLLPGYVPADEIPDLLAAHDVLALTYRSATASQNVVLAHTHGLAVLASRVGTFGDEVKDGLDGLLVDPDDVESVVAALRQLADPATVERLRAEVRPPDLSGPWARYVGVLEYASSDHAARDARRAAEPEVGDLGPQPDGPPTPDPNGGLVDGLRRRLPERASELVDAARDTSAVMARAASRALPTDHALAEIGRRDFPDWVRPTDVVAVDTEAARARELARDLGLPRGWSKLAEWSALGALRALVSVRDDGQRSALTVDASGARSPFATWAQACGFAPVELPERAGRRERVPSLGSFDDASLDMISWLHPRDVPAEEFEWLMVQAGRALRPGGLLCVTQRVGGGHPGVIGSVADLRGVVAQADDLQFSLVGDLDGELTARLRHAAKVSDDPETAHAVVRLSLRRR